MNTKKRSFHESNSGGDLSKKQRNNRQIEMARTNYSNDQYKIKLERDRISFPGCPLQIQVRPPPWYNDKSGMASHSVSISRVSRCSWDKHSTNGFDSSGTAAITEIKAAAAIPAYEHFKPTPSKPKESDEEKEARDLTNDVLKSMRCRARSESGRTCWSTSKNT